MNNQIKIILPWVVIALFVLFQIAHHFLSGLEYSLKSQKSSPDGLNVIYEFRSNNDGVGHAPYGTMLSLSKGNINSPNEGYVIFAGYCKHLFAYSWQSNSKIIVSCHAQSKEPVRTQAMLAYGINVVVKSE